jgi:hypothetical protein
MTVANQNLGPGGTVSLSSVLTYSDSDSDAAVTYRFWDGGSDPSSGYFAVPGNGHAGTGQNIDVAAANLSSVVLHAGSVSGTETMYVQAYDGHDWGAWTSFTLTSTLPVNHAPTLSAANHTVAANSNTGVASWLTYADADSDAAVTYRFWDGGQNGGYLSAAGTARATAGQNLDVAAADLASVVVHGGPAGGAQTLWVQAYDGHAWGAWSSFTLTTSPPPVNHVPTMTVANQSLGAGGTVSLSSILHYADADSDAAVTYRFWDGGTDPNSGYFSSGGGFWASGQNIDVAAANLGGMVLHAGAFGGTETMWVQAYDGHDWSSWTSFTLTSNVNHPPTLAINSLALTIGGTVSLSSILTYADADSDAAVTYRFWDSGTDPNSGYFSDNANAHEGSIVNIDVAAADLGSVILHAGSVAGSETMYVQAYDGHDWGASQQFDLTTNAPVHAPTVAVSNHTVAANSTTAISTWLTYADVDNDAAVTYQFWDDGTAASSGYFSDAASGHEGSGAGFYVAAADLSSVMVHGGSVAGSETLWARAYDGHAWGTWTSFTLLTA